MKNREYDTLTLYAKKNKVEEVVENYKIFGWELVNETENDRYEDILDLSFVRPHKIKNKDELQLRQVYMEDRLNSLGKLEKHKNSKTTAFGLCLGTIFLALIVCGLYLIISSSSLAWGIVLTAVGVILLIFELIFLPKLHKKEKLDYETKTLGLKQELKEILDSAKQLQEKSHE